MTDDPKADGYGPAPRDDEAARKEAGDARAEDDARVAPGGTGGGEAGDVAESAGSVAESAAVAGGADASATIRFSLDGRDVDARPGETILQAARRHGTEIPHLCYSDGMRPDGNCRACVVEIEGERVLAPSCFREPTDSMKVHAANERSLNAQRMVLELLLADMPRLRYRLDSELEHWCDALGVEDSRYPRREQPAHDLSHPGIAVRLDACIQCTRCVRACREVQVNDVIGYAYRGAGAKIVFDFDDPMGTSTCVACGECVQACPTGALLPASVDLDDTPALEDGPSAWYGPVR